MTATAVCPLFLIEVGQLHVQVCAINITLLLRPAYFAQNILDTMFTYPHDIYDTDC